MHYKIAQLILTPGQKASTTSEIFVAQPDAIKEELAGKLFMIIEIESKKVHDLKIISFLIETLNNNYYHNEKMILRERVKTVKIEHIFESALAKTNKNLAEFLRVEKIKLNLKLINATCGIIYEDNLYFANIGKNKALLIYKKLNNNNTNVQNTKHIARENNSKYNAVDIIGHADNNTKKTPNSSTKLFSSVISGRVPRNGYFVFANEALLEYLSNKQLIEIVTILPPGSAAEQMKNILTKINYYVSFLALIVKNTSGLKEEIKIQVTPSSTEDSLTNLNTVEETTEKLLTSREYINFKKWLAFLDKLWLKIGFTFGARRANRNLTAASGLKDKIFFRKKSYLSSIKKLRAIIQNIILHLIHFFILFFKFITDKEKIYKLARTIKSIPGILKEKINLVISWFKKLSKRNKILLVVALGFLLLFTQNILLLTVKNKQQEKKRAYANLIELIKQKQNQVEASLLYANEDGARILLNNLEELLTQLPQKTKEQTEQYSFFASKYEEQIAKIRHEVNVANPEKLADFTNLNAGAKPTNIILASDNNKIYAGDSIQKTIYSLDVSNNLITAIADLSLPTKALKYPALSKGDEIYYFSACPALRCGDNNITQLNSKTEEISNLSIKMPANPQSIVSAAGFNNRLYLLDKENNQVYRHTKEVSGFSNAVFWIKEKADFSKAISMSIEGYIYILKSNGQLLKYLKGQKQDFELDIIEPPFENAAKVIVSSKLKFIYILEPAKKRLAIFDKTGDFLMQYKIEQFNNLKDFIVDEGKKKIYFLDGASVYEVEGMHFE